MSNNIKKTQVIGSWGLIYGRTTKIINFNFFVCFFFIYIYAQLLERDIQTHGHTVLIHEYLIAYILTTLQNKRTTTSAKLWFDARLELSKRSLEKMSLGVRFCVLSVVFELKSALNALWKIIFMRDSDTR